MTIRWPIPVDWRQEATHFLEQRSKIASNEGCFMNPVTYVLERLAVAALILTACLTWSQAPGRLGLGDHHAEINGVTIGYSVQGRGPILLVEAPGWGVGSTYLRRTLAPLEQRLTLVFVDPRGSGQSSRPATPTKMSTIDMAEDLEGLRQYLGLATVAVLGHSHGGEIVAAFAARYPTHVDHLILVDAVPPKNPDAEGDAKSKEIYDRLAQNQLYADAVKAAQEPGVPQTSEDMRHLLDRLRPLYWHDQAKASALANLPPVNAWAGAALNNADLHSPFDLSPALSRIAAPVLIMAGKDDYVVPLFEQDVFRKSIPNAQIVIFEQSGHFPWIEEPDKFWTEVAAFLRR